MNLSAGGGRLSLTNAHTHVELCGLRHLCPPEPADFVAWQKGLIRALRDLSESDVRQAIAAGVRLLQDCGTTQVADVTQTWWSAEPLLDSGLRGVVYLEIHGLDRLAGLKKLSHAQRAIERLRRQYPESPMRVGLSLHAPYSCHPDLLRQGADWCRREEIPLSLHVAESSAETALLVEGRSPGLPPWHSWLQRFALFRPALIPGLHPVPFLAELGVLEARPLLFHAVQVGDDDLQLLVQYGCAVVHCPRSNHLLRCGRMRLEKFLAAGIPVFFGTDSLASSPSLDVRDELAFARTLHEGRVSEQEYASMLQRSLDDWLNQT